MEGNRDVGVLGLHDTRVGAIDKSLINTYLVHLLHQGVDVLLSVTVVTTLDEVVELSSSETTVRVGQVEWPQEVVGLLEVRTNGVDLVDQVLDRQDTVLAQVGLDDGVFRQRNSLLVDLTITSLVHQLSDGGQAWVTVSNVWLDQLDQLRGSLGDSDEHTGVDLGQSQQLQNLSWLRSNLGNTLDSDNEDQLRLSLNVVRTVSLSLTLSLNDGTFSVSVLLDVLGSSVKDDLSLFLVGLLVSTKFFFSILSPERWLIE